MDKEPGRWVTLGEAAHYFKVSERTMRRRIKAGQLRTQHSGGRVLVLVYGLADSVADKPDTADASGSRDNLADITSAELAELKTRLEEVTRQRDYLEQALAREQAINMAAAQKLIEARTDPESNLDSGRTEKPRRWWWPWG